MADHVVILDPNEYDKLKQADEVLTELFRMDIPMADRDVQETVALAFMENFDPSRAGEWGHVSYCFRLAMRTALRVAAQEASKR